MKKAIAAFVMAVLSLAAACAPSVPTPTPNPEPTPTPIRFLATELEHLDGIWLCSFRNLGGTGGARYYRFDTSQNLRLGDNGPRVGTLIFGTTVEGAKRNLPSARCWFEDGVFYAESNECWGSYRAYLDIEDGRAVGLRFVKIDESDLCGWEVRMSMGAMWTRVD